MIERTFSIVKPDAVNRQVSGQILTMIQGAGLKIVAMKMIQLTKEQAEGFYAVHKERPFFDSLVTYMCSGPIVCSVLEGENAMASYRELMGATNPKEAAEGTIRQKFAVDIEANSVHGSDSVENAKIEINYFFSNLECVG